MTHRPDPDPTQTSAFYICPMHPEVRQEGPGNCPRCGMTLVPEHEAAGMPHGKAGHGAAHGHGHQHQHGHDHAAPIRQIGTLRGQDARHDSVPAGFDGPVYTCPMHPEVR